METDPILAIIAQDTNSSTLVRCKKTYVHQSWSLVGKNAYQYAKRRYVEGQILPRREVKGWKAGHWEIVKDL